MAANTEETFPAVGKMGLSIFVGLRAAEIPDLQAHLALYRQAWREAGTRLLEPIMRVEVTSPEANVGDVLGDLNARRAQIEDVGFRGNQRVITAKVPLRRMFGYSTDLPLESMYRAARAARIYDGPDEVHRQTVARRILRDYTPPENEIPTEHVPTRRAAAREKFAALLESVTAND